MVRKSDPETGSHQAFFEQRLLQRCPVVGDRRDKHTAGVYESSETVEQGGTLFSVEAFLGGGFTKPELFKKYMRNGRPTKSFSAIERERVNLGGERAKMLARALKCHPAVLGFPGWDANAESAA